jgi:hypothetical protein
MIAGGTIEFDAASSVAVTFDNGAGGIWTYSRADSQF